tara:strand:- start:505 stop:1290 length:786 start_codon:yes stop_codon:yes gene_type:complete
MENLDNQAVISEYINQLKISISDVSAESALAKARYAVLSKTTSDTIATNQHVINDLSNKISILEVRQEDTSHDFTSVDEKQEEVGDYSYGDAVDEKTTKTEDEFSYQAEEPKEQIISEETEVSEEPKESKSSIEVDLLRQIGQLKSSTAEQEDYITRLESGIEEGNTIISKAESSRDEALQKLKDLESSHIVALQKAKEVEEKLKQKPVALPTSNVVDMKTKRLEEDFIKLEIQNSKLMRDLGSAENKIKELKNKATKGKQ